MNDPRQGTLNPTASTACARFPGIGTVVWGARTLVAANPAFQQCRCTCRCGAWRCSSSSPCCSQPALGGVRAERRTAVGRHHDHDRRLHARPVQPGRVRRAPRRARRSRSIAIPPPPRPTIRRTASSTSSSPSPRSSPPNSSSSRSRSSPARPQAAEEIRPMGKPFTVNINRFDPYKTLPVSGLLRHLDIPGRRRQQGQRAQALLRRDRVQGGRQRRSSARVWAAPNTSRSRSSAASPTITTSSNWANAAQVLDNGSPNTVAGESAPGDPHRPAQRGGPAGLPLPRPPRLGLGIPGAARPRRRRQRDRHRAHQARERGLGARPVADASRRSSDARMITLPISGQRAQWRPSNGHDDMALADSGPGLAAAVAC